MEELRRQGLVAVPGQPRPRLPTYDDVEALPFLKAVINVRFPLFFLFLFLLLPYPTLFADESSTLCHGVLLGRKPGIVPLGAVY